MDEEVKQKSKKEKPKSRSSRWFDAVDRAKTAAEELNQALSDLNDIKSEYEDWQGNLPENLQSSAVGEKLEAVCSLDFEEYDTGPLEEAEGIDLPLGFGRD